MSNCLLDAVYGCLIGGAIGDALGAPVEGWYHHEIANKHGRLEALIPSYRGNTGKQYGLPKTEPSKPGAITDDTTMRHVMCLAIVERGGRITPTDYAEVLLKHLDPLRVWRSDRIVLEKLKLGMSPWDTGRNNMPNAAAAMAIAPVGVINAGDPRQAYQDGFLIASVTQDGTERDAAAAVATGVAAAFAPAASVESVIEAVLTNSSFHIRRAIEIALDLAEETGSVSAFRDAFYAHMLHWHSPQAPHKGPWNKTHFFSGSSLEVVPAALALLKLTQGDVNEGIIEGVAFGRDNDTIASIVGNIAGALRGASQLKADWIETCEHANEDFFVELEQNPKANFLSMAERLVTALKQEHVRAQQKLEVISNLLA
ncbi:MAG: ADP-ribosylglycohydrolase family protein [Deinococcota bacterium]